MPSTNSERPGSPAPAALGHLGETGQGPSLLALLRNTAPNLWAKSVNERATRREQRERLLELAAWLLRKNGAVVTAPARQNYFHHQRVIEGRVDLEAVRGAERLVVELAFSPTLPVAYKLLAARKAGASALLLCGFATTPDTASEAFSRLAGRETGHWFAIGCLAPLGRGPA